MGAWPAKLHLTSLTHTQPLPVRAYMAYSHRHMHTGIQATATRAHMAYSHRTGTQAYIYANTCGVQPQTHAHRHTAIRAYMAYRHRTYTQAYAIRAYMAYSHRTYTQAYSYEHIWRTATDTYTQAYSPLLSSSFSSTGLGTCAHTLYPFTLLGAIAHTRCTLSLR